MGSTTAAGSELAISVMAPATQDEEGYQTLTFTDIGQLEQIGGFGATTEVVTFQPLKGPQQKFKGPTNYGALSPAVAGDEQDAGQALMVTAAEDESQKLYSFRVTKPDGALRYFGGRVFGQPETIGAANTMIMTNPSIEISTKIVKVAAPAPAP